jgi:hypothetical protein
VVEADAAPGTANMAAAPSPTIAETNLPFILPPLLRTKHGTSALRNTL